MKRVEERPLTPAQMKALHATFKRLGWDEEERHGFIAEFTKERTSSTKELTLGEARAILNRLNGGNDTEQQKKDQAEAGTLVRSIFLLSFMIKKINAGFDSSDPDEIEMNKAKVDMFCKQRGAVKKNIRDMNLAELRATKKQFEAIAGKERKVKDAHKNAGA